MQNNEVPILFWSADNKAMSGDSLYFSRKIGNTLAIVYSSDDTNGGRESTVLFIGGDAEAVTMAWNAFVQEKCFALERWNGEGQEPSEIHLNTRMLEVLSMFRDEYKGDSLAVV